MTVIDKIQKIVLAATVLVCTAVIVTVFIARPKTETAEDSTTNPLSFDTDAVQGIPEVTEQGDFYSTLEIPLTSGNCRVSIDASPKADENRLYVYFTNSEENTVWLKLVIYDDNENEISASGIIRNGEYVKAVKLNRAVTSGEELNAKILTYEPDTYYSLGSVRAMLKVN